MTGWHWLLSPALGMQLCSELPWTKLIKDLLLLKRLSMFPLQFTEWDSTIYTIQTENREQAWDRFIFGKMRSGCSVTALTQGGIWVMKWIRIKERQLQKKEGEGWRGSDIKKKKEKNLRRERGITCSILLSFNQRSTLSVIFHTCLRKKMSKNDWF